MIIINNLVNRIMIVLFLILTVIIIFIIIKWFKLQYLFESFIITVDEVILGSQCPDYLAYDGFKYYLVFNNKIFDNINNPLIFNNINDVKVKLKQLNCPINTFINNIIELRRVRKNDDPQENLERSCSKHIANNLNAIDKCAFNYAYSTPELSKEFTNLTTEELSKINNTTLDNIENKVKTLDNNAIDNYKKIRKLIEFINQNDESVMVDYDLETCMFEKINDIFNNQSNNTIPYYLKDVNLGSKDNLHKFRKHFAQQQQNLNSNNLSELDNNTYLDNQSMAEFIKFFNNSNNVIEDKVINTLF